MLWAFYLAIMSHGRGVEEYSLYSGIALQTLTYFHLIPFYFRWPGDGERGKTNLRWITRNWAVAFATIMTKISSTRRRVSATCIASSVTCRACWDTPLRSCTPCWMWSQMLTSDGHRRNWGHPAETFQKKKNSNCVGWTLNFSLLFYVLFSRTHFSHSGVGAKGAAAVFHWPWVRLERGSEDLRGGWVKKLLSRFSRREEKVFSKVWWTGLAGGRN